MARYRDYLGRDEWPQSDRERSLDHSLNRVIAVAVMIHEEAERRDNAHEARIARREQDLMLAIRRASEAMRPEKKTGARKRGKRLQALDEFG